MTPARPPEGAPVSGPKVMIVDDNVLNVELVSFVLGEAGFELAVALDAEQALAKLPAFEPVLVLMDIQMPGMDGLALTRRLKNDPATRHIVILAFTAYAMKGDEAKMRAAGCDGYISKPIDVKTFASRVRQHLPAQAR